MTVPADNAIRGSRLRPYIWLVRRDAGGRADLPQSIVIGPDTVALHNGNPSPIDVGGFPGFEFRTDAGDRLCVLVKIANCVLPGPLPGAVVIAWFPTATGMAGARDLWDAAEAALPQVVRAWPCQLDVDGSILTTAMDASVGAAAVLVQSNWPATWRKLLPTDPQGSMGPPVIPPGPPTGPRIVGAVIAT